MKKGDIRKVIDGFATRTINTSVLLGPAFAVYMVPSMSEPGEFHVVSKFMHGILCSCKGFRFGKKGDTCSHIEAIQHAELKQSLDSKATKSTSRKKTSRGSSSASKKSSARTTRKTSSTTRQRKSTASGTGRTRKAKSSSSASKKS